MGALLILQQWWYYGTNDAAGVEDVVQRVMECHYLTTQNYEGCIDMDCQDIIDCIESSPELRAALQALGIGTTETPIYDSAANNPAFNIDGTCNEDVVWGYVSALVDYIDQQNVDFLQQMSEALNVGSGLDQLLQLIPGYELLPFDDIQDFIENFGDYNLEAYQASMTTGVRNQIKCDIFCMAISNGCSLDFGQVYQYMIDGIGNSAIDFGATFLEFVYFMIVGSYPSDRIVYIWSAFQLFLVMSGNEFLGLDTLTTYKNATINGDPDNDWETLCDECCESVSDSFDFTVDDYDEIWTERQPSSGTTVWVDGVGYRGDATFGAQIFTNRYVSIQDVTFVGSVTNGNMIANIYDYDEGSNVATLIGAMPYSGDHTVNGQLLVVVSKDVIPGTATLASLSINGCSYDDPLT